MAVEKVHVKIHLGALGWEGDNWIEINGKRLDRVISVNVSQSMESASLVTIVLNPDATEIEGDVLKHIGLTATFAEEKVE